MLAAGDAKAAVEEGIKRYFLNIKVAIEVLWVD